MKKLVGAVCASSRSLTQVGNSEHLRSASAILTLNSDMPLCRHTVSGMLHPRHAIRHRASCELHPDRFIQHNASCELHPDRFIQHNASCELHPSHAIRQLMVFISSDLTIIAQISFLGNLPQTLIKNCSEQYSRLLPAADLISFPPWTNRSKNIWYQRQIGHLSAA